MEDESSSGAHGYVDLPQDEQSEFIVIKGWGRGLRIVRSNPGGGACGR